ncbi:flavonol synthase [Sphingopyxis sp. H050]|jgi:isopenicillin N synthase-like dioxygenase|uniref:isopenicillin N synthase family dioxygenase n=1 Tax=Sphingopyxis sp. H050 TaxID=1759072 RepID=UPI0007365725|nr:2-oxoglutarate and iron-dependent oxygenase domain-containing protein [Sphingopyxis sp. H050]KTE21357.1 flavonol synthase [Sphingopyxis sp. H050]
MTAAVPVISMSLPADRFAHDFGASFERFGFAMITDHGIDPDLIDEAWTKAKDFFALPEEVKRTYHIPGGGGARGYTPFGTEIAKGAKEVDLKEFWHVGRDLPAGHRLAAQQPNNVWPAEVEGFRAVYDKLFAEFDRVGGQLLAGIARYLGLAPDFFDDTVKDGNSVMRLLHYPPVEAPAKGIRAEAHEDINTITLLLGAEEAGLEILDKDGSWLPVSPPPGAMAVNVGDMLQRLTNNKLPSTTHRVRNPDEGRASVARYSMPFFLHFRSDYPIETLESCIDDAHPDLYPTPITADEYLQERLREIGLKK